MKHLTTLLILTLGLFGQQVWAQTTSAQSGNGPLDNGYQFNFNGIVDDNCTTENGEDNIPGTFTMLAGYSLDSVGGGILRISTDGEQMGWNGFPLKFYEGNCTNTTLDFSQLTSQRVEIKLTASDSVPQFQLYFTSGATATDSLPLQASLKPGDTTLVFEDIDFHQWAVNDQVDSSAIDHLLIKMRINWNDNDEANGGVVPSVIGQFDIHHIIIGEGATVGLNERGKPSFFDVYPNPSQGQLEIQTNGAGLESVRIIDALGQLVYQSRLSSSGSAATMDVSHLDAGVYLIEVLSVQGEVESSRLVLE